MGISTHRIEESDRAWVSAKLGKHADGAIDQDTHRIEVVEDGADKAFAIWIAKPGYALLGPVIVDASTERRDLFHAAIVATAKAAVAEGYIVAKTLVNKLTVVRILEDAYGVKFTPAGRNMKTGKVDHWSLTVDPRDIIATAERKGLV